MTTNRMKLFAIIFLALPLLAITVFKVTPVKVAAHAADDPAAKFAVSCKMCHTAKAEKFFDATKSDAVLVQVIMKGKKGDKPPSMPAFEGKVTEDEAKGFVTYMKSLRAPAN